MKSGIFFMLLLSMIVVSMPVMADEEESVTNATLTLGKSIDMQSESPDIEEGVATNKPQTETNRILDKRSAMVDWATRAEIGDDDSTNQKIEKLQEEAQVQNRVGNLQGALEIYDKILEINPDLKSIKFAKGTLLIKKGDYEEALDILFPLMEENPGDYFIKNNIAWIYATAEDISIRNGRKSVSLAREALLQAPSDYHVWNTLSEAYFISARYEKAREVAEIAFKLARRRGVSQQKLKELAEQVRKCKQAAVTMSIME